MSESSLRPESRPFHPQGNAWQIIRAKDELVMADGGVGTGKSRACLEKLLMCAEKYPKMRGLILRKTRKSCTDTCLVTWEDEVLPEGHPAAKGAKRQQRSAYHFPNGSEIVVGGMDNPTKIMSSQWDFVYINEALELTQEEVEAVLTRMRNGKMPYQIILMDTNPDAPSHWLWKMHLSGGLTRIPTTLMDNRRFYDEIKGDFTEEGASYLGKIQRLTGSRRERLLEHKWSIAEGARFPQCSPLDHLFDADVKWRGGLPDSFVKFITIDHGTRNPYCALWHAVDFDGNVWTYREDYETGCSADIQAQRIVQLSPENESYFGIYFDPSMDAQNEEAKPKRQSEKSAADFYRETFQDKRWGGLIHGIKDPEKAYPIIDALLNRHHGECPSHQGKNCQCEGNGFANWYIERSCTNLWEELVSLIYYKTPQGIWTDKVDPKCSDHAVTSAAYGFSRHFDIPEEKILEETTLETLQRERMERRKALSERNFNNRFGNKPALRY